MSGTWYFLVFFDPMYNEDESVEISFSVSYETGVTGRDRWINARPFLIGLGIVVLILIIIGIFARSGQKQKVLQAQAAKKAEPEKATVTQTKPTSEATPHCLGCGSELRPNVVYCPNCGRKREGRKIGDSGITTPAQSKICSYCGSKLSEKSKFCATCGTRVEQ
jgi:hypothetical protein